MSALVATAASSWRTGFFYGSPLCALTLDYVFLAGRTTTTFCSSQNSARSDKRSICLALSHDAEDRSESVTARPITREEINTGKFTIFDVVMPSPGFDVEYPAHPDLRALYERIMAKEGLSPYQMRHKVKEFSLSGAYRHVVMMPGNVQWWYRRYSDPLQQMVRTDLDIVRAREETGVEPSRVLSQEEIPEGDRVALILKFRLGPSQYATMALR
ncbi:pseudouridine synthase [Lipomyces tetrasporus]